MIEIAPDVFMIDTLLGGWSGITAAYLLRTSEPALVETGAQTSSAAVLGALSGAGLGPPDLASIVLTHVHLDHCGAAGRVAAAFPNAQVVVHRRGARHLADPERLIAGSAAVYGDRMPLYGGLDPVPAERIVAAEDGHRVALGDGRELVMIEALGHARHHMAILDEATGTLLAGDALGVQFPGGGLYPTVPPPDFDRDLSLATLARLRDIRPDTLCLGHYGPVPDPLEAIEVAAREQAAAADAALEGWRRRPEIAAVQEAVRERLPLEAAVGTGPALERWRKLGWEEANAAGLADWAARQEES